MRLALAGTGILPTRVVLVGVASVRCDRCTSPGTRVSSARARARLGGTIGATQVGHPVQPRGLMNRGRCPVRARDSASRPSSALADAISCRSSGTEASSDLRVGQRQPLIDRSPSRIGTTGRQVSDQFRSTHITFHPSLLVIGEARGGGSFTGRGSAMGAGSFATMGTDASSSSSTLAPERSRAPTWSATRALRHDHQSGREDGAQARLSEALSGSSTTSPRRRCSTRSGRSTAGDPRPAGRADALGADPLPIRRSLSRRMPRHLPGSRTDRLPNAWTRLASSDLWRASCREPR
jgi:hypothetical protein